MNNYLTIKRIKADMLNESISHPVDVRDFVMNLNPHDGAKYRRCAVLIAVMGITPCDDGEERFFMPATSDVMYALRHSRNLKKVMKKVAGA